MRHSLGRSGFNVQVLSQFKAKLKNRTSPVVFLPTIREPKKAIEGPNSYVNLLVNCNDFWRSLTVLCLNCRCFEKSVSCELAAENGARLINRFGVRCPLLSRGVVSLVNQNSSVFVHTVFVRCV